MQLGKTCGAFVAISGRRSGGCARQMLPAYDCIKTHRCAPVLACFILAKHIVVRNAGGLLDVRPAGAVARVASRGNQRKETVDIRMFEMGVSGPEQVHKACFRLETQHRPLQLRQ